YYCPVAVLVVGAVSPLVFEATPELWANTLVRTPSKVKLEGVMLLPLTTNGVTVTSWLNELFESTTIRALLKLFVWIRTIVFVSVGAGPIVPLPLKAAIGSSRFICPVNWPLARLPRTIKTIGSSVEPLLLLGTEKSDPPSTPASSLAVIDAVTP